MSITKKLVLTFILVLATVIGSVSALAIYEARQAAEKDSERASLQQIKQVDYSITQFFRTMRKEARFLASDPRISQSVGSLSRYLDASRAGEMTPLENGESEADLYRLFRRYAEAKGGLAYVYFGSRQGEFVQWPIGASGAPYDPRERPWYEQVRNTDSGSIMTDAYYFEADDTSLVSVAHEVRDEDGNFVGAVGIDVSLQGLMDMINNIEMGEGGRLVLIEDNGTILANPLAPETNFTNVDELDDPTLSRLASIDEGSRTVTLEGTSYQATVFTSPELGWRFMGLIPRDEMMAGANQLAWQIGVIGLLAILISAGIAVGLARFLTSPIRRVTSRMYDIAAGEGDLTQRLPEETNDEIGQLSRQFNAFVQRMQETIQEVDGTTQSLASAAEELNHIATQTRQSVERQGNDTDQIATAINEMTATVQEVSRNGSQVADAASDADTKAREGGTIVAENAAAMETLGNELDEMTTVVGQLSERSQEIKTVLDVIHSVTEQTNLLALNAAIEAARAGEQGRGFAVVADEVRALAQRSSKSAEEIQGIIDGLIAETNKAVETMKQAKERSNENQERATSAKESLTSIEESVSTISDQVTQIATAAEEQSQAAEEINQNVTRIVEAAQESSSGTEQTNRASDEVASMAERLREVVGHFKI
ncbi:MULTISPECIES: methyl-accepting chemotaxis protein [Halomonadaceae]|uniref:HAMP domain-containing protein n=1 Tax=Vreelandella halophila TaxID=86177 RepID=A0A9X4YE34_9GAMM|nr:MULTISPECIES: methyl-accepting chemotaxis protein [Halomonas]MYL28132.1 HAMP domain-containing protein [Halomonas utahensis]MYL75898.1 HAMP domain-containing protein [Halomonas sp. 22501_18_FS]